MSWAWLERAVQVLDPALNPVSAFWSRWSAVRYLNDDFPERLRWEFALLDAVGAELPASERVRLEGDRLARCRLAIPLDGLSPAVSAVLGHLQRAAPATGRADLRSS